MKPYFQNGLVTLYHGDCFTIMPELAPCALDMVCTDPPYGVTKCDWDRPIDYSVFFDRIQNLVKRNAAIAIFSQMPVCVDVINANRRNFRYEIVWRKSQPLGFLNAKKMPLRAHENILIFYGALPTYNPQKSKQAAKSRVRHNVNGKKQERFLGRKRGNSEWKRKGGFYGPVLSPGIPDTYEYIEDGTRYPTDVVEFSNWNGMLFGKPKESSHPTQKSAPLLEYLIRTYTNEGQIVLDPLAGSGSTGVAAMRQGRRCILIEMEEKYCEMAARRMESADCARGQNP